MIPVSFLVLSESSITVNIFNVDKLQTQSTVNNVSRSLVGGSNYHCCEDRSLAPKHFILLVITVFVVIIIIIIIIIWLSYREYNTVLMLRLIS